MPFWVLSTDKFIYIRLNVQVLAAGSSSDDPARLHLFLLSEFSCSHANSWAILNPLAHSNRILLLSIRDWLVWNSLRQFFYRRVGK